MLIVVLVKADVGKGLKEGKAESLLSQIIKDNNYTNWDNLAKEEQKTLLDIGWDSDAFNMSDYAIAPLKDISGTIQDPVLWISIILGGIRIGAKVLAAIPEYLCIDGDCGNEINGIDAVFPKNPGQLKHIFRNAVGHLTYDNPSNRDLLLKTVSPDNFIEVNQ